MNSINHPQLFYPEYSEKLIAALFAKKGVTLLRLLTEAKQKLDKDNYYFELSNVISALQETGEFDLKRHFWSQVKLIDKQYCRYYLDLILKYRSSDKVTPAQELTIKHWEEVLTKHFAESKTIKHWVFDEAIADIGFVPSSLDWSNWCWYAARNREKCEYKKLNDSLDEIESKYSTYSRFH